MDQQTRDENLPTPTSGPAEFSGTSARGVGRDDAEAFATIDSVNVKVPASPDATLPPPVLLPQVPPPQTAAKLRPGELPTIMPPPPTTQTTGGDTRTRAARLEEVLAASASIMESLSKEGTNEVGHSIGRFELLERLGA